MNGEVNGTMEETAVTSVPSPLETGKKDIFDSVVDTDNSVDRCKSNTEDADDSNHVGSPAKNDDEIDEHSDTGHSNGKDNGQPEPKPEPSKTETSADVPKVETRSNDTVNNHCSNSNESCADSLTSSVARSETTGQDAGDGKNKESMHFQEVESCSDSESDDDSILSGGLKATDTVSIDSDSEEDDSSQESRTKSKNSDIIILDAENRPGSLNGNSRDSGSPEIHEITSDNDNDDCVVTNSSPAPIAAPRRSDRAVKRKTYDDMINGDDESDIEEVELDDPLDGKPKSTPKIAKITDRWGILEKLDLVAKAKSDQDHQESGIGKIPQNLYQSMVARGLVVTPTSSNKTTSSTQVSPVLPTPQPVILPSLTDDMFVVEAPSFIVPYVYEKPSVKPFREFVDKLGKELEEIKAKEDKERLEKEKAEKEKREQDRKERRERGEEVEDSPDEEVTASQNSVNEEKKKKKAQKRARRKARDDDDASWDGESSSDSEDETLSDDDTVVLKDKMDSVEDIKHVTDLVTDKVLAIGKGDNYFDCSLGKFFVDIGLNLVQEYVQSDLLKQQNRKLYREKKAGHSTKATLTSIASLTKNLDFSKENNAPYTFAQKKCEHCSFKTESELIMKNHLETPHMKNNLYKCNFCEFEIKSPHDILSHMDTKHNIRGKLERAPAVHQCPNCPFEDNGKGKLGRHQIACAKRFKPELNLSPPMDWEPPAKIPKMTRMRNTGMNPYQSLLKGPVGTLGRGVMATGFRPRGRSPATQGSPARTPLAGAPVLRGGLLIRHNAPPTNILPNNYPHVNNVKPKPVHQPSISITPLPHQQPPLQAPNQASSKSTFVICEICDGYIKDLEQLRNHMQWIHKVKIHPKMIYNRPPLNCQKCQFRFFTDQGLERHLLGSHGLVTSSMQEAANKGKDAGRCPVCGRVYQWKLLNHVARDHNLTLKPAHLSYKCTVCTATFGMYKQFENHVYSAHSVVAKRVMDKTKTSTPAKPAGDSLLKPIKIRDEITITPQPAKPQTSAKK